MSALHFPRPIGPPRFRPCAQCLGSGEMPGEDTFHADAIANSTACPECLGKGGAYFPLHGYDYDALLKLAPIRARYLAHRFNTRPDPFLARHTVGEMVALQYGVARQLATSPVHLPDLYREPQRLAA